MADISDLIKSKTIDIVIVHNKSKKEEIIHYPVAAIALDDILSVANKREINKLMKNIWIKND